jgi:carbamoyltransferase
VQDKVIAGISGGHNAGITIYNKGEFIAIELERLFNHKNLAWCNFMPRMDGEYMTKIIKHYIKEKYGIDKIDVLRSINSDWENKQIGRFFNVDLIEHNQVRLDSEGNQIEGCSDTNETSGDGWAAFHHKSHAAGTFYQSPFDEALVFSFDGGGDDGWNLGYHFDRKKERDKQMKTIHFSFNDYGNPYFFLGYFIDDIKYIHDYGEACLTYAGKLMGYCSYGSVREDWIEPIKDYYSKWNRVGWNPVEDKAEQYLSDLGRKIGLHFDFNEHGHASGENRLKGDDAKDLIATSQYVFEELHFNEVKKLIDFYKTNVCITGGCGMNILYNTRIRDYVRKTLGKDVYIAPNSSDCGLSTGLVIDYLRPDEPMDLTYAGEEVYDDNDIFSYMIEGRVFEPLDLSKIIDHIFKDKHIYGVVQGRAEHGPRALGNRSIICSPAEGMKKVLNDRVKHREFFRPFAPIVRLEDVSTYFDWEGESRHMNFAAYVKEEYREQLASITHSDGTARIQTVTREQNELMYDMLTEAANKGFIPVLLNTSFNVAGKPILNTYKDAFAIMGKEDMNGLIIKSKYLPDVTVFKKS